MAPAISPWSLVVAKKGQVSWDLVGEVAILHLASGTYYGRDAVGDRIWGLIEERGLRVCIGAL